MQEETYKRLLAPELGPCACTQVRRFARKLSSLYDGLLSPEDLTITQYSLLADIERQLTAAGRRKLLRSFPLWEEAQRKFLSQIGTESLQELRTLLTSSESAITKAFPANPEKP